MKRILYIPVFFIIFSCSQNENIEKISEFQPLDSLQFQKDLKKLGEKLFFDQSLSIDNSISCASCHIPALAFTDGKKRSIGIHNRTAKRNSPTLITVAHQDKFMWDGGIKTLELQALVPLQDTNEMGSKVSELIPELQMNQWYDSLSRRLYGHEFNAFTLTQALSCFQKSLYYENSTFDEWQNEGVEVSKSIKNGYDLFKNRLNCAACHSGKTFTNSSIENNGLYKTFLDPGHFLISADSSDIGKFKVPTLRNIEITGPYMHDGSFESLEEVIIHYESGGKDHFNKSKLIQPFELTDEERKDLISFLKSLTDKQLKSQWEKVFN
ncbi:MAG: cytochrome-c peroxidase [Fluviicola sp.]|nr:MAG: cytochrome-c peroxidase [Fluviicola sp.]